MLFKDMNHEELQKIITNLDQVMYNHQVWFNALIRTIICHLPPDQRDMSENSYKECRFGQWYYSQEIKNLTENPGVKAIEEEHVRMHFLAKLLLNTVQSGKTISPPDYDNFSNILERLRLEINTLKREIENLLYTRDPLTGTINRMNMLTILRELQEQSKREGRPCFIAMMDLDHFKEINDQLGHPIGDNVLAAVSHLIYKHLDPQDKIFRYGGEEFLICLSHIDGNTAFQRIEELRNKIAEVDLIQAPRPIRITVSFGLTNLDLNTPVEQSIERCDKALLAAKKGGRNCTQFWNQVT